MISQRVLDIIKTTFNLAAHDSGGGLRRRCRLCNQELDSSKLTNWKTEDYARAEAFRANPNGEAVPWTKVADGWLHAPGHHPECPIKELADLVISIEECFEEEPMAEQEAPSPAALDAHTMARVAMHFRGYLKDRDIDFFGEHELDHPESDTVIADYEEALGGTPDRFQLDSGDYLYDEYHEGGAKKPLSPKE